MTNKEKEKLIKSFKSFKYNPETNIKEEYTNVGIDWCIEEIQECDCGKKDKLDEILEKYRIQKLKEEKTIEFQTDEIKRAINSNNLLKAKGYI